MQWCLRLSACCDKLTICNRMFENCCFCGWVSIMTITYSPKSVNYWIKQLHKNHDSAMFFNPPTSCTKRFKFGSCGLFRNSFLNCVAPYFNSLCRVGKENTHLLNWTNWIADWRNWCSWTQSQRQNMTGTMSVIKSKKRNFFISVLPLSFHQLD